MNSPSLSDVAYAAGLFDGEGTICIAFVSANPNKSRKAKYARYSLRVSIGQTDVESVKWMHDVFGGSLHQSTHKISYKDGRSARWNWTLSCNSAAEFLVFSPSIFEN
jgi:hypothetical protein